MILSLAPGCDLIARNRHFQELVIRSSAVDPLDDLSNHFISKLLAFVWHSRFMFMFDLLDQKAGFGIAGNHYRSIVASTQQGLSRGQA